MEFRPWEALACCCEAFNLLTQHFLYFGLLSATFEQLNNYQRSSVSPSMHLSLPISSVSLFLSNDPRHLFLQLYPPTLVTPPLSARLIKQGRIRSRALPSRVASPTQLEASGATV